MYRLSLFPIFCRCLGLAKLAFDNILTGGLVGVTAGAVGAVAAGLGVGLLLVGGLAQLGQRLLQSFAGPGEAVFVVAFQGALHLGGPVFDLGLQAGVGLVAQVADGLLGLVDQIVGQVTGFDYCFSFPVRVRVSLGFSDHAVDLALVQVCA